MKCFSYGANWMGPVNKKFIEEYGDNWAMGRVDIRCNVSEDHPDYDPWGHEFGIPAIDIKDFAKLREFCHQFTSDHLVTEDRFYQLFEKWLGRPIKYLNK